MNLILRQKTETMTKVHQPLLKKESLPELLYLFEKSLKRYGYLQKHGAPDTLLNAEKNLFCSRLLTLRMELKK
jgi:hypothetical protein